MLTYIKGQGATEYLVLLAVVLIVAMVAIVLLGFFPGLAVDAKISQSDSYWRGTASPFAILEHSQASNEANLTIVMQNKEADQRIINNITVNGSGIAGSLVPSPAAARYFSAGEKRTFYVDNLDGNCTQGNSYEYTINIDYSTAEGTDKMQWGEKPLIGKCA
jgi:hypothetical protein